MVEEYESQEQYADGDFSEIAEDAGGSMDDDELEAIVAGKIQDAIDYVDSEIGPIRAEATRRYFGKPYGDEEEGRSQVVSMDVRDTVAALMPSLLRVFFSSERPVEFAPHGPEDVQGAEQATDYINSVVFNQDNNGFTQIHAAFKDALTRKSGIVKYWWDKSTQVKTSTHTGLDEQSVMALMSDPDIEMSVTKQYPDPAAEQQIQQAQEQMLQMQMPVQPMQAPMLSDVTVTRRITRGVARFEALPPEEFIISRRSRSIGDAPLCGHRSMVTGSDLIALGYPEELLDEVGGSDDDQFLTNDETFARNPQSTYLSADGQDAAMRRYLYVEAYVLVDYDGDGIAELRKVCTLGPGFKVVGNEPVDERPFAMFCPDPEPHTVFGMCPADVVQDIARIKTRILRNMLDSLGQSIHPRMVVVEGQVSMADAMNNEVGGIIRASAPGMVQPLSTPFVGQQAFPMLEYLDELKESRTGISKASAGLDADALQSTTATAVAATVSAAQAQIETIARVFAETGMKDLMRGLLKLIVENQDKPRMVRLRNQWVPIDPRSWNSAMDVVCNVALGRGTDNDRMQFLSAVAQKQESIFATMGPQNQLVGMQQYRATLAKMVELAGFKDASQFFTDPSQVPPATPPAPPPDPAQILAQVEAQKISAQIATDAAKLELEREKAKSHDDRERDKLEADIALRARDIELKYQSTVDTAQITALIDRDREVIRAVQADNQAQMQAQATLDSEAIASAQQAEQQPEAPL
jgi:hypothetical protein